MNRRSFLKAALAITVVAATPPSVGAYLDGNERVLTNFDEAPPSAVLGAKDGIEPQVGFVKTTDGVALRYASFAPASAPKGTIFLKPGKSGCIEDFQDMANAFVKDGYHVFCADPRGMGLSGRELKNVQKVHVDDFARYVEDDALLLEKIVKPKHQNGPLLLVAHSLSGHNAVRGIAEKAYAVDGVVAIAPMLEAKGLPVGGVDRVVRNVIKGATKYLWRRTNYFASLIAGEDRNFEALGTPEQNDYTNNPQGFKAFVARWRKEPRLVTGGVSTAWVDAYYRSVGKLLGLKKQSIETPTLFCCAKDDTIISNERIKAMADKFQHVSIQTIDEKHDVEMGNAQTLQTLVGMTNRFVPTLGLKASARPTAKVRAASHLTV